MKKLYPWNRYSGVLTLRSNTNGNNMLTEVACLIGSKDLKFDLVRATEEGCLSFKEAWFASSI